MLGVLWAYRSTSPCHFRHWCRSITPVIRRDILVLVGSRIASRHGVTVTIHLPTVRVAIPPAVMRYHDRPIVVFFNGPLASVVACAHHGFTNSGGEGIVCAPIFWPCREIVPPTARLRHSVFPRRRSVIGRSSPALVVIRIYAGAVVDVVVFTSGYQLPSSSSTSPVIGFSRLSGTNVRWVTVSTATAVSTLCKIPFHHSKDVGTPKIEVVDALSGRYIVGLVCSRLHGFLVCWDEGTIFGLVSCRLRGLLFCWDEGGVLVRCFVAGGGGRLLSWHKRCGFSRSITGS
jgi:hypothetical protein